VIAFALLDLVQYYSTGYVGDSYPLAYVINIVKSDCVNTAVAIQTFEWLNTWCLIRFQKQYDITEIPIEKRKFQPKEAIRSRLFFGALSVYFIVTIVWVSISLPKGNEADVRKAINQIANPVNWVFLVVTTVLFAIYARRHSFQAFNEYKKAFAMQVFGMVQLLTVNFILDRDSFAGKPDPLLYWKYLELQIVQNLSLFIFVSFKQPFDLFSKFSKCPEIQFSIFQYPHFFYAEQRLVLMQNKAIIADKLADLNQDGKLFAVLDDDDILNASETIQREKLGMDIDFFV